jgi:MFS family permease
MSLGMAGFAGMFMLQIPTMLGIATGGWISDRVAVRNARQRMLFQALCYFCAAPFLLPFLNRPGFILVTVAVSVFSLLRGLGQANENPILCDVIPPQFRSTAIGFMNCLSTAAGGAGVLLAGILKGGWGLNAVFAGISIIFVIAGAALLVGYFIFMPRDTQRARDYEVAMAAAAPIAPPDAARR